MKKTLLFLLSLAVMAGAMAQTQKGFVRTIGRLGDETGVKDVRRVDSVMIKLCNGKGTMTNRNGNFEFEVGKGKFCLKDVFKKNYKLRVPQNLSTEYYRSPNDFEIVVEDTRETYKIKESEIQRRTRKLYAELSDLREKYYKSYEENKITQEEYDKLKKELNDREELEKKNIETLAEWYATTDFAAMDSLQLRISRLINEGKTKEALDLIHSQGDISASIRKIKEDKERLKLSKEETAKRMENERIVEDGIEKQKEKIASLCYSAYLAFLEEHQLDSALYCLNQRLELDSTNTEWLWDIATFYHGYIGDYNQALEYYNRVSKIDELVLDENHPNLAITYNNIGLVYELKGDYATALQYYDKARKIYEQVLGENHPELATTYSNIGSVYGNKGDYATALQYYDKARKIQESVLGNNHPDLAMTYNNIGLVYSDKGDYATALQYYDKARKIYEQVLGENHPALAMTYNNIGSVYSDKGDYATALQYYDKVRKIQEQVLGENHPDLATTYNDIGFAYQNKGDYDSALQYYDKARKIRERVLGENHPDLATTYGNIGEVYADKGDYDIALKYYDKARKIQESVLGNNHPDLATTYNNIGMIYLNMSSFDVALDWFNKSMKIQEQILPPYRVELAYIYGNVGFCYDKLSDCRFALKYFTKAWEIFKHNFGDESSYTKMAKDFVDTIKQKMKEQK